MWGQSLTARYTGNWNIASAAEMMSQAEILQSSICNCHMRAGCLISAPGTAGTEHRGHRAAFGPAVDFQHSNLLSFFLSDIIIDAAFSLEGQKINSTSLLIAY